MTDDQTIFAPATASGKAGVAVFRVSGNDAAQVIVRLCEPNALPTPRRVVRRRIKNPQTGGTVDHALVLYFPAPHSFTGEDVVELHTHGGRAVAAALIEGLRALPHFRLAEPGEFSRRAFENGKMDLTEAEAIADLVAAETEAQRKQALRQMEGALGALYENWRERLTRALAYMEAAIDFSDEEFPEDLIAQQSAALQALRDEIFAHLNDNHRGERLREGFSIAILGPPNAGKSSLLNALARREAAIVSPIAGTTRDVIEVHLDIGGYPVTLADTAGLRACEGVDVIENEGIRRARARAAAADLKLVVLDGTVPDAAASMREMIDADTIVVVNKADLIEEKDSNRESQKQRCGDSRDIPSPLRGGLGRGDAEGAGSENDRDVDLCSFSRMRFATSLPNPPLKGEGIPSLSRHHCFLPSRQADALIHTCALTGSGIDALLEKLAQEIERRFAATEAPPLTRARHRAALEACAEHLTRALHAPMADKRAEDVRLAMRALGRITGRVDVEDVLDMIFRDFCIGK
ncbi:MAG: tRNA uridine-5-carboxymethylaminomethyl(34) synthesis GTPase MnmE [Alphaproteobacteria bacterium]|nr:tRNA uridine-5-carboxymethylaminomethyl(34) synthesis GTPase MnmE [Alphaproteobacteria bacterium]